jgi:hypothetical protein
MSRGILEQIGVVLHQPADNGELCITLHLLWTLCFDEACRSRVIARDDLIQGRTGSCSHTFVIDVLQRLRTHADDGVRRAANGVQWLLNGRRPTVSANGPQRVPHALPTLSTDHIMISYQWAYKDTVRTLGDTLKKRAYPIWLDVEQMSKARVMCGQTKTLCSAGSVLEAMASAVENARVVVVCVSESYKNSPSCRTGELLCSQPDSQNCVRAQKPNTPIACTKTSCR